MLPWLKYIPSPKKIRPTYDEIMMKPMMKWWWNPAMVKLLWKLFQMLGHTKGCWDPEFEPSVEEIVDYRWWVWIKVHYLDDHAHSNCYTLSCLKNGGRHRLNLVWVYTWTLPPFFRQERVYPYTLFPAQFKYNGATKSVGVHSFLPPHSSLPTS